MMNCMKGSTLRLCTSIVIPHRLGAIQVLYWLVHPYLTPDSRIPYRSMILDEATWEKSLAYHSRRIDGADEDSGVD